MGRRVYYDLAREVVVAICALVILATFFYVFNDFLNVQVQTLSTAMRDRFGEALSYVLLVVATVVAGRNLNHERRDENSIAQLMSRLGEEPKAVRCYKWLRAATLLLLVFFLMWYVILNHLVRWPLPQIISLQALCLVGVALGQLILKPHTRANASEGKVTNLPRISKKKSTLLEMAHWRLAQLVRRNRLTQFCFALAALFVLLQVLLVINHAPFFVLVFNAFIIGLFAAFTLAFQLQEDLDYIWAERLFGISHEQFIGAYQILGIEIGAVFALSVGCIYWLKTPSEPLQALKLAIICLTPCLIMPLLLFQIDPRKPAIQIMLIILIGLFIVTAIYAHWLALILLWAIHYYGTNAQKGRFYRA